MALILSLLTRIQIAPTAWPRKATEGMQNLKLVIFNFNPAAFIAWNAIIRYSACNYMSNKNINKSPSYQSANSMSRITFSTVPWNIEVERYELEFERPVSSHESLHFVAVILHSNLLEARQ